MKRRTPEPNYKLDAKGNPIPATSTVDYRAQWPWANPGGLAYYSTTTAIGTIVEIMAYPFHENGEDWIMIREVVGDPTSLRQCRMEDLRDTGWPRSLQIKYVEGFTDGWAAAAAAVRRMGKLKEDEAL